MDDHELLTEIDRLFLERVTSVEKLLGLSRADAARLLVRVFERATTLEVLAVLYKEYGYADPDAQRRREEAARRAEETRKLEEEARLAGEMARKAEEEARRAAEKARQAEAEARRLKEAQEKARRTEEEARQLKVRNIEAEARAEAAARKQAEEARQLEASRQAEAEAEQAREDALRAEQEARQAALALTQIEAIRSSPDPVEIRVILSDAEGPVAETALQRLAQLFQERLLQAQAAREAEALVEEIPAELSAEQRQELLYQLGERWKSLLLPRIEAARSIEELSALTLRLTALWQICEASGHAPPPALEQVYAGMSKKWLQLAEGEDLRLVELPGLSLPVGEEQRQVIRDAGLKAEVEAAWETFVRQRIETAQDLRSLRQLYDSQNWDECFPDARKLILSTWDALTVQALDGVSSFRGLGDVARRGGSQIAIHRWIEAAADWDQAREVYAFIDQGPNKTPHYPLLVEKILAFADSEDKIHQAQSLLRSQTVAWMMGDKTLPGAD